MPVNPNPPTPSDASNRQNDRWPLMIQPTPTTDTPEHNGADNQGNPLMLGLRGNAAEPTTDSDGELRESIKDLKTFHVLRGGEEIPIVVRLPDSQVDSIVEIVKAYSTAQLHTVLVKLKDVIYDEATGEFKTSAGTLKDHIDELLGETTLGDSEVT